MYSKGTLADAPITDPTRFDQPAGDMYCNGPRMHEFLREMHNLSFSKYDEVMTVGELPNTKDPAHVLRYVSYADRQLSMIFNFDIVDLGTGGLSGKPKFELQPWKLSEFKRLWTSMQQFIAGTDGWATSFLENHDQGRSTTRFATEDEQWRDLGAKMLATFLATLTGTLFVYQGQEIGMVNAEVEMPLSEYKDVDCLNYIKLKEEETSEDPDAYEYMKRSLHVLARDHARLPMSWDWSSPNAGFTGPDAKPWMRISSDYKRYNVADQIKDSKSVLSYWKRMLKLRKEHLEIFTYGDFQVFDAQDEDTFVFVKRRQLKQEDSEGALVALNFTSENKKWLKGGFDGMGMAKFLVGNYPDQLDISNELRPWEARVYLI